jgi:hypothetical protein
MGLELRRLNIIAAALAAFIAVTIGDLTDVIGGGHAGIGGEDVGIPIESRRARGELGSSRPAV